MYLEVGDRGRAGSQGCVAMVRFSSGWVECC